MQDAAGAKGRRARGARTGELGQAVQEGLEPGALDDEDAVGVEAAAAADDVGHRAGRQRGRAPRREAAEQRAVQV